MLTQTHLVTKKIILSTILLNMSAIYGVKNTSAHIYNLPHELIVLIFQDALRCCQTRNELQVIKRNLPLVSNKFNLLFSSAFSQLCNQLAKTIDRENLKEGIFKKPDQRFIHKPLIPITFKRTIQTWDGNVCAVLKYVDQEAPFSGKKLLELLKNQKNCELFVIHEYQEYLYEGKKRNSKNSNSIYFWLKMESTKRLISIETLETIRRLMYYFPPCNTTQQIGFYV